MREINMCVGCYFYRAKRRYCDAGEIKFTKGEKVVQCNTTRDKELNWNNYQQGTKWECCTTIGGKPKLIVEYTKPEMVTQFTATSPPRKKT